MHRQTSQAEPDSHERLDRSTPTADAGPFGWLPRVSHRQVGIEQCLGRWTRDGALPAPLHWLAGDIGAPILIERPEIYWRAAGLGRAGLVAHIAVPRLATRLAMGIEVPLAHTVVDRLLGFDRTFAESRLQLTPVEWGVWTFLFLRALDSFEPGESTDLRGSTARAGDLGPAALTLDRVGPDPFDPEGIGPIVTVRWPVRIASIAGAVRLWLPESLIDFWLSTSFAPGTGRQESALQAAEHDPPSDLFRRLPRAELIGSWRALAGTVTMSQGLRRLRTGGVLPLAGSRLTGTPASPSGDVDLIIDVQSPDARFRIPTQAVADSGGRLLRLVAAPRCEPRSHDPIVVFEIGTKTMPQPESPPGALPGASPLDVPVTLTVELGRVNVTLTQLADLKPGDVIELNRHSRAAVELTSNGRLVARGELILIDTDLGVRVTGVFL